MATPQIAKFNGRIILKHDSAANWAKATNFKPLAGEIIIYEDTDQIKIGDGTTTVPNLPFLTATIKHGTASALASTIPLAGEIIKIDDTGGLKIGNGTSTIAALPYISGVASTATEGKMYLLGATEYNKANTKSYSDAEVYSEAGELNATSLCVSESVQMIYDADAQSLKFVFG